MREAIPVHELPPLGQLSRDAFIVAYDAVIQMAEELFARILQGLRSYNASIYEKLAHQTEKRMRAFALQVWDTYLANGASDADFFCFCEELDATLHVLLQQAITAAWIGHEAHYSDSAREKARGESVLGPTAAFGAADVKPNATGQLGPTDEVNGDDAADGRDLEVAPHFPKRAAWLLKRLAERAWNRNDPLRHRGPDPKTIDRILRGETVREDILEKLARALSQKGEVVGLLDIPRN
jgi:hypothetical protein